MINFLKTQFDCCAPVWIGHGRAKNNSRVDTLDKHCLAVIYSDKTSLFQALLEKGWCSLIHNRTFQILATEMYLHELQLSYLNKGTNMIRTWDKLQLTTPTMNSVYHGAESFSLLGPKMWNIVSDRLNNIVVI